MYSELPFFNGALFVCVRLYYKDWVVFFCCLHSHSIISIWSNCFFCRFVTSAACISITFRTISIQCVVFSVRLVFVSFLSVVLICWDMIPLRFVRIYDGFLLLLHWHCTSLLYFVIWLYFILLCYRTGWSCHTALKSISICIEANTLLSIHMHTFRLHLAVKFHKFIKPEDDGERGAHTFCLICTH